MGIVKRLNLFREIMVGENDEDILLNLPIECCNNNRFFPVKERKLKKGWYRAIALLVGPFFFFLERKLR